MTERNNPLAPSLLGFFKPRIMIYKMLLSLFAEARSLLVDYLWIHKWPIFKKNVKVDVDDNKINTENFSSFVSVFIYLCILYLWFLIK